jgi:hypothetical protein
MPHTNKPKTRVPPPWKPASFINVSLSGGQKEEVKHTVWTVDSLDNALNDLLGRGYKFTLRFDTRNDCFAAWLFGPDGTENAGYILAGRGSTPHKAIKQACYIHYTILEQDWGADQGQEGSVIDD